MIRISSYALFLVLLLIQTASFGAVTRWNFSDVNFSDGGTATGFFDFNSSSGSLGTVENWQITVSGGNESLFPELVYSPDNSTAGLFDFGDSQPRITFSEEGETRRQLRLTPADPLTDAGGTVVLDLETDGGGSGGIECFNCSPSRKLSSGSLVAGSAEEILLFSQFGNGGGLVSDLVLTNTTTLEASCRVEFRNGQGLPLALGLDETSSGSPAETASSVEFSLPPFGTVTIPTDGLGAAASAGSAAVFSNRRLGGVVRFSISGIGIAGVGPSTPMSRFVVPVRRIAGVISTGLALRNASSTPVQIEMTLVAGDGTEVPNGTRTFQDFPASGHLSQFIEELFADAETGAFEGSVRVEVTGGEVAATALELGTLPGEFTTLPVIDLLSQ